MAGEERPVAFYYKGWDGYQQMLTEVVAPLSAEQLERQASPSLRPVWTIAAHIIAARVFWFHTILGEGAADIASLQTWDDDGQSPRSAAELELGLDRTWHLIEERLARWTADDLEVTFPRRNESLSRQWVIWHVLEHDLHHGGELCFSLGLQGIKTPDL